jgi:hypothetical protein
MATSTGSHAGNVLPEMESTLVQRTTDSPSVGEYDADLGSSAAKQRPVLLTEDADLVPDNAVCLKRQRALKRRMGPRRDANKIVKIYRDLQRKVLPKEYAEDPSPYDPAHIFCVLY